MIAHICQDANSYLDTLTIQIASRIHRMRRKNLKFMSIGTSIGSGESSGEDAIKAVCASSEPDPSSSDLSADTVIYVGPIGAATDGEHPPIYIPGLSSENIQCSMTNPLRRTEKEVKITPIFSNITKSEESLASDQSLVKQFFQKNTTYVAHATRLPYLKCKEDIVKYGASDEQWIDGPRISKSQFVEVRNLMKGSVNLKNRETWVDGPLRSKYEYGFIDNEKKIMISKWIEYQSEQLERTNCGHTKTFNKSRRGIHKRLTKFKSNEQQVLKSLNKNTNEHVKESIVRRRLKISSNSNHDLNKPTIDDVKNSTITVDSSEDEGVTVPVLLTLPLIQKLSTREVSPESFGISFNNFIFSNADYSEHQKEKSYYENLKHTDEDKISETETEEFDPFEPVTTKDSCLQVTEEDIALSMGYKKNPLPQVNLEDYRDRQNRFMYSNCTNSINKNTKKEKSKLKNEYLDEFNETDSYHSKKCFLDELTRKKFDQLSVFHQLYTTRLSKAHVSNSETYQKHSPSQTPKRSESLTLIDNLYGNKHDSNSVYSEPAYTPEKFCENCKANMTKEITFQNWYTQLFLPINSKQDNLSLPEYKEESDKFLENMYKSFSKDDIKDLRQTDLNLDKESVRILENDPFIFYTKSNCSNNTVAANIDSQSSLNSNSFATISGRAESGYDSIVRDSDNSSIGSDGSRYSHRNKKAKCKLRPERSFCSWFLNPFTCKYIDKPPETYL